jgi:hypothetical protein
MHCIKFDIESSPKMRIELKDGTVIEGTETNINTILKKLHIPVHYYESGASGRIPVYSMSTTHIRTALLNRVNKWAKSLYTLSDEELVHALRAYVTTDDTIVILINELKSRINN